MSWSEFILSMGLHTAEEIESVRFGAYWAESVRQILDKGDLRAYWAPQPPPAARPTRTMAQRLGRLEEDVHGLRWALGEQREVLDSVAHDFSRFTTWTVTGLLRMMDQDGVRTLVEDTSTKLVKYQSSGILCATHSVISSAFASCVTTTPTLLDYVLCISTPMQDSVRITHVYRNLPLWFDDKIHAINALPLDMCEFDIVLGKDWLTEHHAMIDCRSYRVMFGDIHAPEFNYHGSIPEKSMQIISALQARSEPISKAPYHMASVSPWGAPVLF
nr:putative reverse transcriptase domain-containing protein [Tanacetum cinerariifolium]